MERLDNHHMVCFELDLGMHMRLLPVYMQISVHILLGYLSSISLLYYLSLISYLFLPARTLQLCHVTPYTHLFWHAVKPYVASHALACALIGVAFKSFCKIFAEPLFCWVSILLRLWACRTKPLFQFLVARALSFIFLFILLFVGGSLDYHWMKLIS